MKKLFLLAAAGHVALLGLIYYWLGLGEASVVQLVVTAVLALVIALLAAWLIALPFAASPVESAKRSPLMLLWLVFAAVLGSFCYWLSTLGDGVTRVLAGILRIAVDPEKAGNVMGWVATVVAILLAFGWALPVAQRLARDGFRSASWRAPRLPMTYWFIALAFVIVGLVVPWSLFNWTPKVTGPYAELGSFIARAAAALSLYVGCWLAFARYLGGQTLPPPAQNPIAPVTGYQG